MVIKQLEKKIGEDEALRQQLKNGSRHAVEATFQQVAKDAFEDLVNDNYKFYKKVSDDPEISKEFFARMFDWYIAGRSPSTEKKK
jgi:type I restriction enzyme R subunit